MHWRRPGNRSDYRECVNDFSKQNKVYLLIFKLNFGKILLLVPFNFILEKVSADQSRKWREIYGTGKDLRRKIGRKKDL